MDNMNQGNYLAIKMNEFCSSHEHDGTLKNKNQHTKTNTKWP